MKTKSLLLLILTVVMMASCKKDTSPIPDGPDGDNLRVNTFISQAMGIYYLWNEQIPTIDDLPESDPVVYFKSLLVPEDRFSIISDDYDGLMSSIVDGVEQSFGYNLSIARSKQGSSQFIAVVNFVYPNSPASKVGIKRGDFIEKLNNQIITEQNYRGLVESGTITISVTDPITEIMSDKTISSVVLEMNPVHISSILDVNGTKVGYLHYTSYISKFNDNLKSVFAEFKQNNVKEVILDLRYNGGGDENAITFLCSCLAPESALSDEKIIIKNTRNKILTEAWGEQNLKFKKESLDCNLNLSRIFILTSGSTYSASEVTVVGLNPYMKVVTIGEKTGGKYTGMTLVRPIINKKGDVDPEIANWCIFPITSKYENIDGLSPKGGIVPTYEESDFQLPFKELGSKEDNMIAKAISIIEGNNSYKVSSKSANEKSVLFVDAISSKYDQLKRNIIIR